MDLRTLRMLWLQEAFQFDGRTLSRAKGAQFGPAFRPCMCTPNPSLERTGDVATDAEADSYKSCWTGEKENDPRPLSSQPLCGNYENTKSWIFIRVGAHYHELASSLHGHQVA